MIRPEKCAGLLAEMKLRELIVEGATWILEAGWYAWIAKSNFQISKREQTVITAMFLDMGDFKQYDNNLAMLPGMGIGRDNGIFITRNERSEFAVVLWKKSTKDGLFDTAQFVRAVHKCRFRRENGEVLSAGAGIAPAEGREP